MVAHERNPCVCQSSKIQAHTQCRSSCFWLWPKVHRPGCLYFVYTHVSVRTASINITHAHPVEHLKLSQEMKRFIRCCDANIRIYFMPAYETSSLSSSRGLIELNREQVRASRKQLRVNCLRTRHELNPDDLIYELEHYILQIEYAYNCRIG